MADEQSIPEEGTSQPSTSPAQTKSESEHSKPCQLCGKLCDVLIRCQIDESEKWFLVCTGKCWKAVSGGTVDGDSEHKFYRYGGVWKNKHEAVSGKKPKAKAGKKAAPVSFESLAENAEHKFTNNDLVSFDGNVFICRKSHCSSENTKSPPDAFHFWREKT